jgi:hypothetical protein
VSRDVFVTWVSSDILLNAAAVGGVQSMRTCSFRDALYLRAIALQYLNNYKYRFFGFDIIRINNSVRYEANGEAAF